MSLRHKPQRRWRRGRECQKVVWLKLSPLSRGNPRVIEVDQNFYQFNTQLTKLMAKIRTRTLRGCRHTRFLFGASHQKDFRKVLDRVRTYNLWTETFGPLLCDGQQWQQVHHREQPQGGRATTRKWPLPQKQQWKSQVSGALKIWSDKGCPLCGNWHGTRLTLCTL